MKKKVDVSDIKTLLDLIESLKYKSHAGSWDDFDNIISFIEDRILKVEQEEKNEYKRVIYKMMKEATTEEDNKKLYCMYQDIDIIFDSNKNGSPVEKKASRMLEILEKMEEYGINKK